MKKAQKYTFFFILIEIISISSLLILNIFVKDQEMIDFFANCIIAIVLIGIFSFLGYLIIKTEKYMRNQKIFLLLFLIIIGLIDIILLIIALVSGLWIYFPILGIYNSISLGTFVIVIGIIDLKSSKK